MANPGAFPGRDGKFYILEDVAVPATYQRYAVKYSHSMEAQRGAYGKTRATGSNLPQMRRISREPARVFGKSARLAPFGCDSFVT
jgi:hypothetical protein